MTAIAYLSIIQGVTQQSWFTYERTTRMINWMSAMAIKVMGWYYLFIIMYLAEYDKDANDSCEYIPKNKRWVSTMIANTSKRWYNNTIKWIEIKI